MLSHNPGAMRLSNAILAWCAERQIDWHYIAPGKLMQHGFVESFNGRMRDGFILDSQFHGLRHPRAKRRIS